MSIAAGKMKDVLQRLGFYSENRFKRWVPILMLVMSVLTVSEAALTAYHNWANPSVRFMAVEDVIINSAMTIVIIDLVFYKLHMDVLISITEEGQYRYTAFEDNFSKIARKNNVKMEVDLCEKVELAIAMVLANIILIPGLIFIYRRMYVRDNVGRVAFPLPYEFHHIGETPSIHMYLLIYSIQSAYTALFMPLVYLVFISGILAMYRAESEIKTFHTSGMKHLSRHIFKADQQIKPTQHEYSLKEEIMFDVVRHHQFIYRKLSEINSNIPMTALAVTGGLCLEMCLCLFYFVEVKDLTLKLKYFTMYMSALSLLYIYYSHGQDVVNESTVMRQSLSECEWVSKPPWFKRSLLVMMTRANAPIEIKPIGIFSLNFETFLKVVNAAYSYFNIVRTVEN